MKANEFFRSRGLSYCKEILVKSEGCVAIQVKEDNSRIYVDDLKRLVESHELVESYGTLEECKNHIEYLSDVMKQAISDVESCQ